MKTPSPSQRQRALGCSAKFRSVPVPAHSESGWHLSYLQVEAGANSPTGNFKLVSDSDRHGDVQLDDKSSSESTSLPWHDDHASSRLTSQGAVGSRPSVAQQPSCGRHGSPDHDASPTCNLKLRGRNQMATLRIRLGVGGCVRSVDVWPPIEDGECAGTQARTGDFSRACGGLRAKTGLPSLCTE